MPLWTIFTKCPEPAGPQWSQPSSSGVGSPERPGVRSIAPRPGASEVKIGESRETVSSSPPIMRQKPRSSPKTPPLVPQLT